MLSDVIWKNGPWNICPLFSCAIIVPRVAPVSVQLKLTPIPPFCDCPVPKPLVVQPAMAIAASDAAANPIDREVMTILLLAPKPRKGPRRLQRGRLPLRPGNETAAERARVRPCLCDRISA